MSDIDRDGTPGLAKDADLLGDISMGDGLDAPSPANLRGSTPAGRTSTPMRNLAAGESNSRAASALPEPFAIPPTMPMTGAPVRKYINSNVTGPLLEGMKKIAVEQYVRKRTKDKGSLRGC